MCAINFSEYLYRAGFTSSLCFLYTEARYVVAVVLAVCLCYMKVGDGNLEAESRNLLSIIAKIW